MLDCGQFHDALTSEAIDFFTGVPDSLLSDFCAFLAERTEPGRHITAANEGNAIALAAGHYLATGNPGLVYMQNSGLGNAVNPLASLVDPEVYSIPVLLLIGWRGEPGTKDEPQHVKQGRITLPLLQVLGVDHEVLPPDAAEAADRLRAAARVMRDRLCPYALVVRKGTFAAYSGARAGSRPYAMMREDAVRVVAESLGHRDVLVATTGKASRELFEHRARTGGERPGQDFLTVGSMGHASQIALAIALAQPTRQVFCLDGDGALIMHMGSLAIIGTQRPRNLTHVVVNNGAHDSVGGQPTAGFAIDIPAIARACGYPVALRAETDGQLRLHLAALRRDVGPALLEIRVSQGARADLGRPTVRPRQNAEDCMRFLSR